MRSRAPRLCAIWIVSGRWKQSKVIPTALSLEESACDDRVEVGADKDR